MIKKISFTFVFLYFFTNFLFSNSIKYESKVLDLTKLKWEFKEKGSNKWYPAKPCSSVHTDLMKNKIIDDPFYGSNEKKYQWVGKKDWVYRTYFLVNKNILNYERIDIEFNGLDTYANVFLNKRLILKADNFFRMWVVNLNGLLKKGRNELIIEFESPEKRIAYMKKGYYNGRITAEYIFVRKPAYHFGWDWGPRFVTMGIHKPIYLRLWKRVKIDDVYVNYLRVDKKKAVMEFEISLESLLNQKVEISIINKTDIIDREVKLIKGKNLIRIRYEIENPKLWFPFNLGKPFLYDFKIRIEDKKRLFYQWEKKIGIRKIRLVQKRDKYGKSFYFEVNGIPVFIKGANYIPQDNFLSRVDKVRYERLIRNVKESNINMLRVWGGGFYENDIFYDLCDENGILVWQDLMFACAMYPNDRGFYENVKQEVIYNVRRLRNHPSLALWCGNNEIYEGWENWGWKKMYSKAEQKELYESYNRLFRRLIPDLLMKYDKQRNYIHTSPLTNWGGEIKSEGDVHYWGIWHGNEAFENFQKMDKRARFFSEYGFQSFPSMFTINKFTKKIDRKLNSEVIKSHEKNSKGFEIIKKYMKEYFIIPGNFEDFVYVSQVLQAYGIGLGIETHRRLKPYCMGTMYWQLNDCWPVISWSSMDYYLKWKALQYKVKKLYSDVIISIINEDRDYKIFIVSDKLKDFIAKLRLRLIDFNGKEIISYEKNLIVKADSSKPYFNLNFNEIFNKYSKNDILLYSELYDRRGKLIYDNYFYFVKPKDLNLKKAKISYDIKRFENGFKIILKTNTLIKDLYIQSLNHSGFFSDNYFDLLPKKEKSVYFYTNDDDIKSDLIIKLKSFNQIKLDDSY